MKQQRLHGELDNGSEDFGRVVRISGRRGDRDPIAYIVAVRESAKAIELIRENTGAAADKIEDLCRASGALLRALDLQPGDFAVLRSNRQTPPTGYRHAYVKVSHE
jgi:hypothetical protein